MVGQPGIIIAPHHHHHGYPHFNQAQSPPHQPLQGSTGPEVHPGRKPHCRQAPGSPEERQRGGPTGKSHPRTSGLAVFTPGTQPFQRCVRSPLHTAVRRCDHWSLWPGGGGGEAWRARRWDPSRGDLRANAYLGAAPPHLPQAGRSSRKRAARPAPARTPTAPEGRGPRATLRPYRPGDPGIARPGGSSTRTLLELCPASPVLVTRPRVASSPRRPTGGSNVVSLTPTASLSGPPTPAPPPKTLLRQNQGRRGADASPHPARSIQT